MTGRPPTLSQRAFTLVELLIAIVVVGVLLVLAAPSFRDFILLQRLKAINAQLVTDVQFARSEAASRNLLVRMRFQRDADQSCYVLFTGGANTCGCLHVPACPDVKNELRRVQVPGNLGVRIAVPAGQVVAFEIDPSTGAMSIGTDDNGITLPGPFLVDTLIDTARTLRTVINRSGRPSVCRPAGSVMAVPEC